MVADCGAKPDLADMNSLSKAMRAGGMLIFEGNVSMTALTADFIIMCSDTWIKPVCASVVALARTVMGPAERPGPA